MIKDKEIYRQIIILGTEKCLPQLNVEFCSAFLGLKKGKTIMVDIILII